MLLNSASSSSTLWSPSRELSPRIKRLRDEYYSFYERDYFRNEVMAFTTGTPWDSVYSPHNWGVVPEVFLFFESYSQSLLADAREVKMPASFWKEPLPVRRALFFREVIDRHLPVQVLEGELITGGQYNTALSRTLTKKEARTWKKMESRYVQLLKTADDAGIGNGGATPGHIIPDYRTVLQKGFKGLVERFNELLQKASGKKSKAVLRAMIISAEAPRIIAARYSRELKNLAAKETDYVRKDEMDFMADICSRVPWEPAKTFWEALQALWFTHMLVMSAESYPGAGLSYGRFDQLLYPYYKNDIETDAISPDFAKQLLMSFFIKHNYSYDFQGRVGTNQGINSGFGQLITLSGMGKNGEDLTNELIPWLVPTLPWKS
jgi:trans-4-hydroxy-L-proline dehydratase